MGDFAALKPCFLLAYGCLGLFYLSRAAQLDFHSIAAAMLILAGTALLAKLAYSADYLLIAAAAVGIVVTLSWHCRRHPSLIVPSAAVIALMVSLDFWWMDVPHRSFDTVQTYPLIKFAAVLAAMLWAFSDRGIRRYPRWNLAASIIFVLAGLFVLGEHPEGHFNLLHWQAFSAPALDLNAGLVPFYDIPLQYGLGPSLIISTLCSEHACDPMLAFIVICILANGVLLLQMALATSGGFFWRGAVFAAMFCAVFLWGTHGFAMLAFPSISGVRFLPVTFVAFLLFFGWPRTAAAALAGSVWWSPEAAAMSLVIFGLCESARLGLLRAAALSMAMVAGSAAALTLAHHAVYGIWLDPLAWLEYVIHVPGEMPIDPASDVLLLAAALGLGAFLLCSASYGGQGVRDYAVVGLLFAATVYYLGRSHPNNVNNLMPFIVLVAVRALDHK